MDGTFLPDHPAALLKAGRFNKVDVICGATQDDGNVYTAGTVMRLLGTLTLNICFTSIITYGTGITSRGMAHDYLTFRF